MQGFYDFPQEVRGSLFEEEKYITSLAIIFLGILFIYGTYSIITWCAGPRLEDLFRGYVPLTGKQRRHRQRESNKPSIKGILTNKFLLLWRSLILIFKRTKNQLWRFCNPIGPNLLWDSTSCKIVYWRLRRWKLNIQLLISKLQNKRERFANWMKLQLVAFSSTRKKYGNSLGKRLTWTAYKCHSLDQGWDRILNDWKQRTKKWRKRCQNEYQDFPRKVQLIATRLDSVIVLFSNWYREMELQVIHTRSRWKSKWERIKHQLIQRLNTYQVSLNTIIITLRDRLYMGQQWVCLILGCALLQSFSWLETLIREGCSRPSRRQPCIWVHLPNPWQPLMAPQSQCSDEQKTIVRRSASRKACSFSGLSRLALLYLCGLKLLFDEQRLRDPGGRASLENTPQRIEGQGTYPLEPDRTTTADDKAPLTVTQYMDGDSSGHEISVDKRQTQRAKHKGRSGRPGSQTTEREAEAPRHLSKRSECSTAVQHYSGQSPQQGQEERGAIGGVG
jgi:hypothetical protein